MAYLLVQRINSGEWPGLRIGRRYVTVSQEDDDDEEYLKHFVFEIGLRILLGLKINYQIQILNQSIFIGNSLVKGVNYWSCAETQFSRGKIKQKVWNKKTMTNSTEERALEFTIIYKFLTTFD